MNNDVFTLDDNNNAAIRTIGVKGIAESNSPSVFTEDENGNAAIRVTGGGGDAHNKGYFATQEALEEAYATAEPGDYAIVGSTDTVWVWDEDSSAWVDTDTKGQVQSVNGKTGTVVLDAFDVDATAQFETMPTANQGNSGKVVQYVGTTTASYTNGYFYKNVATTTPSSATASQTTGSSLTDVAVVVATFENEISTSGSYAFTSDGTDWSYDGNVVNIADYGISYTGTPVADDVITVVYTAASTTYTWTRVDVQPTPSELPNQSGNSGKFLTTDGTNPSWATVGGLPDQTGNAGKFLTTDGTDASWSDKPLVNSSSWTYTLNIGGKEDFNGSQGVYVGVGSGGAGTNNSGCTAVGYSAKASGLLYGGRVAIGCNADAYNGIAIGNSAIVPYGNDGAIQIGPGTNTEAGSLSIGTRYNSTNVNYKLLDADGTIPADRTSPVTSVATTTLTQTLAANYTYNCGEMTSLDISFPATPAVNYISQLNFSSGATPTSITAPNTVVWLGNDITGGVFVPVASKRYCVLFFYDGTAVRGLVQGA